LFVSTGHGRKGTAKSAVGSARPDSKARPVTVERLRAALGLPEMTETDAKQVLEQLFAFGDVAVQAFIEQQGNASTEVVVVEPFVVAGSMLTPTTFAAA
jgi:hypothetical protein